MTTTPTFPDLRPDPELLADVLTCIPRHRAKHAATPREWLPLWSTPPNGGDSDLLEAFPYLDVPVIGGPEPTFGFCNSVTAQLRIVPQSLHIHLTHEQQRLGIDNFELFLDRSPEHLPRWRSHPGDADLLRVLALSFSPAGIYHLPGPDADPVTAAAFGELISSLGFGYLAGLEPELTDGISTWDATLLTIARDRLLALATAFAAANAA